MKVSTTPQGRSTVMLEVQLPPEQLQRQIDQSVRQLARRTRVPGFRPGKAPRTLLERALGVRRDDPAAPDPIYDDAKEQLFESSMAQALRETDLDVLAIAPPEWTSFAEGEGATYRVRLPVRPEVKLGAYTEYPFALEIELVDEAKVDRVVQQLRDQHASLVPVEGRGAQDGDYAVMAFEGRVEGELFEGGSAERFPLVIGAERMIPGFEPQLLGLEEGEEKTFGVSFPDDYQDEALRGRPAEFTVRILELRSKVLPEADDDFAATVGSYADLAALRADVGRRLEANARDHARHNFSERIIDFAVANATVEIPELLIEREVEVMIDELGVRLAEQGIGFEEYLRTTDRDEAKVREEYRGPAEKRVKSLLVINAVADAEGIEVDEDAVEAELTRARERYADNPRLLSYLESARGRSYIRSTLRRTQTVETLVDRWLAAHPEVGPVPHIEEGADQLVTEGTRP